MRITSVAAQGFRAFADEVEIPLDADTVIVYGANGQGKTSLLDAVMFALCGSVSRLGEPANLRSVFPFEGNTRVRMSLRGESELTITRALIGDRVRTSVQEPGAGELSGNEATARIAELLFHRIRSGEEVETLETALQRAVYLQQDRISDFLAATDDARRYAAISELIGVGRIGDLEGALSAERRRWSESITQAEQQVMTLSQRASQLRQQRDDLHEALQRSESASREMAQLTHWIGEVSAAIGLSDDLAGERVSGIAIDRVLRSLDAAISESLLSADRAEQVINDLGAFIEQPEIDIEAFTAAAESARQTASEARVALATARDQAAAKRVRMLELHEREQELQTLLQLALRHLDGLCPVCAQPIDSGSVQARISSALEQHPELHPPSETVESEVAVRADELRQAESAEAAANAALEEARRRVSDSHRRQQDLSHRLQMLGLSPALEPDTHERLQELASDLRDKAQQLRSLREGGERLALGLAASAQAARLQELDQEFSRASAELADARTHLEQRTATRELATRLIDGLRDVAIKVVGSELERISDVVQRIYASADPHPVFRVPSLVARMWHGRGRLDTRVAPTSGQYPEISEPAAFLSSSQLNVLGVSIFLALSLSTTEVELQVSMLDDPLQSLDDVNLLGLIDTLRRVREQRQLILSTHDERFARLLERKLRPIGAHQRTIVVELSQWEAHGPAVNVRDIPADEQPVRVVA